MKIEYAAKTDAGLSGNPNQDGFFVDMPNGVFVVLDGQGGNGSGEVAIQLACDSIRTFFASPVQSRLSPFLQPFLAQAVQRANEAVFARTQADLACRYMATTVAAIQVANALVSIAHVGDVRVYRWSRAKLTQITEDHTIYAYWVKTGKMTAEEARRVAFKENPLRMLGWEIEAEIQCGSLIPESGDQFLLCSDGLHELVPDEQIQSILESNSDLEICADALVSAANTAGGSENITAVLVRVTV